MKFCFSLACEYKDWLWSILLKHSTAETHQHRSNQRHLETQGK